MWYLVKVMKRGSYNVDVCSYPQWGRTAARAQLLPASGSSWTEREGPAAPWSPSAPTSAPAWPQEDYSLQRNKGGWRDEYGQDDAWKCVEEDGGQSTYWGERSQMAFCCWRLHISAEMERGRTEAPWMVPAGGTEEIQKDISVWKLQNIRFFSFLTHDLVYMYIIWTCHSLMIYDINIPQLFSTLTGVSSTNISTMRFTVSWKTDSMLCQCCVWRDSSPKN